MSRQWAQKKSGSNSSMPVQKSSSKQRPFSDPIYDAPAPKQTPSVQAKRPNLDWSRVTVESQSPAGVQAKLSVGAPGDKYEQEADAMASKVMTMAAPGSEQPIQREVTPEENKEEEVQAKPLAASVTPLVQRETAPEENKDEEVQPKLASDMLQREVMPEEEEEVQTKPLTETLQREAMPEEDEEVQTKALDSTLQREIMPEEEESVQTKQTLNPSPQTPKPSLENQLNSSQGSGYPLPDDVRAFMEPRFGADFSQVRVHTGSEAVQMNRDLNAQAFTHKQDVYFGAGKAPGKDALTAHELTHVVQQTKAIQSKFNPNKLGSSSNQNIQKYGFTEGALIQRFESPEHQDLGDNALKDLAEFLKTSDGADWGKKNKLDQKNLAKLPNDKFLKGNKIKVGNLPELSPGEIIALMGDFYRTPQDLMSAPPEEVKKLLEIMNKEGTGKLSGSEATEQYQKTTQQYRKQEDTYIELAKENKSHFTPGNRIAWEKLHKQALDKAKQAGSNDAMFQEALLIDAAGGHFLTDAFAAGHLFDKNKLEVAIDAYLKNNPPKPKNPEMQAYYTLVEFKGALPQLVLKNIHDRLNKEGVEVANKKGMQWKTFGDDHLKNAQETRRIAALAVYLSRQQVTLAKEKGTSDLKPDEILDLLPDERSVETVTEKAISYIPSATESVSDLIYRQRRMAGTVLPFPFGKIAESNLATIGSPGREKQLEDAQERTRRTEMPQPVPSFTIFEW